jgi:hypothetical protein
MGRGPETTFGDSSYQLVLVQRGQVTDARPESWGAQYLPRVFSAAFSERVYRNKSEKCLIVLTSTVNRDLGEII